ncbi:hypothetical protein Ddc_17314 [Ditylenchus destructor]|nr:hypothetical protein Ddc_17314 [Ditylenchus destructor]
MPTSISSDMSSSADSGKFQGLKNRLFRRWNPIPDVYSKYDNISYWSSKQCRSPALLRICKCRDHVKTDPEVASNKSESLPAINQDVIEEGGLWGIQRH